jgi:hypothetical protein
MIVAGTGLGSRFPARGAERRPCPSSGKPDSRTRSGFVSDDLCRRPSRRTRRAGARRVAGLAAHARIETPLTIGLFGPSGSGKSFALTNLMRSIEDLRAATLASPYIGENRGSIPLSSANEINTLDMLTTPVSHSYGKYTGNPNKCDPFDALEAD